MAILTGSENLTARFYIEGVYVTGGNGTASAAGPNGAIQFNSNGNFAGTSNLLYSDANGGTLTTATIVANTIITPSGNLAIANLVSNGTITGNVITANVITANTGNIANLVSDVITANTGNIANLAANILTSNIANLVELTVTGNANLGDVSNVHIGGGLPGQFLQTDSTGNLVWADAATGNAIPYMTWTVPADGAGQSFVNPNVALYTDHTDMSVFVNGVFVNPVDFTILNDTITFSSFLKTTDSIEIASKSAGTGGSTGTGTVTRVGGTGAGLGFTLTGNVTTSGDLLLTTPNATSLRTSLNLGNVANANLNGNGSQFLAGNGAWIAIANANYANTANIANTANTANFANIANRANSVALANVVGIGNIANINLNGNVLTVLAGNGQWVPQANSNGVAGVSQIVAGNGITLSPTNGIGIVTVSANLSNVTVGSANTANTANGLQAPVANTIITGGTAGQMLITNGAGNLSFATPNVGTVTRVQGNGSGLGFSLSGDVTSSGNLTLVVPNSTSLTTSMGLGNVSGVNLSGNGSQVLAGNGAWVAQSGGGGGGTGYFAAYDSIGRSYLTSSNTTIRFDTLVYDTIGVSYNTTTSVITLPAGKTYRLWTNISWSCATLAASTYNTKYGFVHSGNNAPLISSLYGVGIQSSDVIGGQVINANQGSQADLIFTTTSVTTIKLAMITTSTSYSLAVSVGSVFVQVI